MIPTWSNSERMSSKGGRTVAIDPVCKMQVEETKAAGTSEYDGKTYYFCAAVCKRKFDADPKQYVK
jgi:YHS domain-containing protein